MDSNRPYIYFSPIDGINAREVRLVDIAIAILAIEMDARECIAAPPHARAGEIPAMMVRRAHSAGLAPAVYYVCLCCCPWRIARFRPMIVALVLLFVYATCNGWKSQRFGVYFHSVLRLRAMIYLIGRTRGAGCERERERRYTNGLNCVHGTAQVRVCMQFT